MVKRLIEAGADIDGEGDEHEIGVIGWATCFKHVRKEVADYLLARGAKPTIFSAVALDRADLVRGLVADDPTLLRTRKMSRFEHYRTPLHLAVLKNRPKMVRLLLELGADAVCEGQPRLHAARPCDSEDTSGHRRGPDRGWRQSEGAVGKSVRAGGADPDGQEYDDVDRVLRRQARVREEMGMGQPA